MYFNISDDEEKNKFRYPLSIHKIIWGQNQKLRRFKFNLESVLLLREHTLEDERIKLSKIVQSYNKEKEELENLILKLEALKNDSEKYFQQVGFCTSLINNYGNYLSKIDSEVITQQNIIKNIEVELNKQQENTKKAYIELKTIENLKQKQKEDYDKQVLYEEIKTLDDITNSKRTA